MALAERLVAADPHQAAYRALLGQGYLQAGRFASARQAFTDALQLDPQDGRSALNLALAMIAGGNGQGARALLQRHAGAIPAADLGLALSLSGDPAEGVRILTAAAREQGASVKTRQNLALSLALAGQWTWHAWRRRRHGSGRCRGADAGMGVLRCHDQPADQVASLLGVRPASDRGQPLVLALNAAPSAAVVQDMVQALPQPAAPFAIDKAPAQMAEAPAAPPVVEDSSAARILYAARQEVVQPLAPQPLAAPTQEARVRRMAAGLVTTPALLRRPRNAARPSGPRRLERADRRVRKEDGAQKAWALLTRRFAGLSDYAPQSGTIRRPGRQSLSPVGRQSHPHRCGHAVPPLSRRGGACFVRRQADDRMAYWARPGVGMASL